MFARRLIQGEADALDEFFEHHVPLLYRFALKRVGYRPDLAEEAVQVAQVGGSPLVEQSTLLSLSRVLLRSEGAEAWDTAATAIERGLALADQTGLVVLVPQFLVERAELARLRGDESERLRHLGEAHRLFVEMGAAGHSERLARELGL